MQGHFSFGFTMTHEENKEKNEDNNEKREEEYEGFKEELQEEQSEEESSENMLFMIGRREIAPINKLNSNREKINIIDLEEEHEQESLSSESFDSDKTVNLKKEKTEKEKREKSEKKKKHKKEHKHKHRKESKHKKNKHENEHKKKEKETKKKHKSDEEEINYDITFPMEEEEGEIDLGFEEEEESKRHKKNKKEKKIKKDKKKEKSQKEHSGDKIEEKHQNKKIENQQEIEKSVQIQEEQNKLFPSLLETNKSQHINSSLPSTSLVPLPSHIKPSNPESTHLYTSYIQKLTETSLLPARTIKELSNSIANKNEEFNFLYENDNERFDKEIYSDFFTNGKFPDYLRSELRFDVIRFPNKELYTYGKHMDKEIPRYQLIENFNKVIGVKAKKQHKYEKTLREIYRSLNQKDYSYKLKDTRDKGNDDRYFHYEGYEKLQTENLVNKREKLRYLKGRKQEGKYSNQNKEENEPSIEEQQPSEYIIPFITPLKEHSSLEKKLHFLEESLEEKFKQETRELNTLINNNPTDIELWLKLVNLQDDLLLTEKLSNNDNNALLFVYEKKLSILSRGLKMNPFNEILGREYFKVLFSYLEHRQVNIDNNNQNNIQLSTITEQFHSPEQLSNYLEQFILYHPVTPTFWLLYIRLKLHIEPILNELIMTSITFSHTYIKQIFTQINLKITLMIEKEKSAEKIKKFRAISLDVLGEILEWYNQQGYKELVMGIGVALIEFNLFVPQRVEMECRGTKDLESKKREFKLYWEDYKEERVGDLMYKERMDWEIWDAQNKRKGNDENQQEPQPRLKKQSYIDYYCPKTLTNNPSLSEIEQELYLTQTHWHMANPLYNKPRIRQSIESLILFEDIEKWLLNYRDSENIIKLIEMVITKCIGLVNVWGENIYNRGGLLIFDRFLEYRCIESSLLSIMGSRGVKSNMNELYTFCYSLIGDLTNNNKLSLELFEKRYWPVELTFEMFCLSSNNMNGTNMNNINTSTNNSNKQSLNLEYNFTFVKKVIYTSRLLRVISPKITPMLEKQKHYNKIYQLNEYRLFLLGVMYVVKEKLLLLLIVNREKKEEEEQRNKGHDINDELVNIVNDLMESDEGLLEEMREIIGWWEAHKPLNNEENSLHNGNSSLYNQHKLWSMYIHIEWLKGIIGVDVKLKKCDNLNENETDNNNNINSNQSIPLQTTVTNILTTKLMECVECYQQLIMVDVKNIIIFNKNNNSIKISTLTICRYYTMFLEQALRQMLQKMMIVLDCYDTREEKREQEVVKEMVEVHSLKLLGLLIEDVIVVESNNKSGDNNNDDSELIIVERLNEEFLSMNNLITQLLSSVSVSVSKENSKDNSNNNPSINTLLVHPLQRLELTSRIHQLLNQIESNSNEESIMNEHNEEKELLEQLKKWLTNLITTGDRDNIEDGGNKSNNNNLVYRKELILADVLGNRLSNVHRQYMKMIKSSSTSSPSSLSALEKTQNNHLINIKGFEEQLKETTTLYKMLRYTLVRHDNNNNRNQNNYGDHHTNYDTNKLIQHVLVYKVRQLELETHVIKYNNNNVNSSININRINNISSSDDHTIILMSQLRIEYHRILDELKQRTTVIGSSPYISRQSNNNVNTTTTIKEQHKEHQVELLILTAIKILHILSSQTVETTTSSSNNLHYLYKNLIELKQFIYPIVMKYPHNKTIHLHYLCVIETIIEQQLLINNKQEQQEELTLSPSLQELTKYNNEYYETLKMMNNNGLRMIKIKIESNNDD